MVRLEERMINGIRICAQKVGGYQVGSCESWGSRRVSHHCPGKTEQNPEQSVLCLGSMISMIKHT